MINRKDNDISENKVIPMDIDEGPKGAEIQQDIAYEDIPVQIRDAVDKKIDEKIAQMKFKIQSKITNMQLDTIRQFMQQEEDIESYLETISINNRKQKEAIQQLRAENEKLRQI